MAKNNKSHNVTPEVKVKNKRKSNLSDKRITENNMYMQEVLDIKTADKNRKTKALRDHLIVTYKITKSRANDIAVRAVKTYKINNKTMESAA